MRVNKRGLALGLSMSLLLAGCFDSVDQEKSSPVVQSEEVEVISVIEAEGKVVAKNKREIYLDFPAQVEEVYARVGEIVPKGMPILKLDLSQYENMIILKEKEIGILEGQLKQLKQTLNPQAATLIELESTRQIKQKQFSQNLDTDLISLGGNLELAKDKEEIAQKDYQVAMELLEIGATSKKEVEGLEQAWQVSKQDRANLEGQIEKLKLAKQMELDNLEAQINTIKAQMSNTDKQLQGNIEGIQKQIEVAQIELKEMKTKLQIPYLEGQMVIAGGIDWVITEMNCEKGTQITSIPGPIMKVMDQKSLIIEVDIPEEYIDEIEVGRAVKVIPYFDENKGVSGKISSISQIIVESYGENVIKAEIKLDSEEEWLRLGMGVDVEI